MSKFNPFDGKPEWPTDGIRDVRLRGSQTRDLTPEQLDALAFGGACRNDAAASKIASRGGDLTSALRTDKITAPPTDMITADMIIAKPWNLTTGKITAGDLAEHETIERSPELRDTPLEEDLALSNASTERLFEELIARSGEVVSSVTGKLRDGMLDTPKRAAKAWEFWCGGYAVDVDKLVKSFEDGATGYDEMVIVANIPVHSHCEHHLAPITGVAHVGYVPNGRIVGLSKLPRVVDALSRRFQVQERLTVEIADVLERNLNPIAVGVVIEAEHSCMTTRGVRIHGGRTVTSALRGAMKHEPSARAEFLSLVEMAKG